MHLARDQMRDRGMDVWLGETAGVPDEENGAEILTEALRVFRPGDFRAAGSGGYFSPPSPVDMVWNDQQKKEVREAAQANAAMYALIDRAARCPVAQWHSALDAALPDGLVVSERLRLAEDFLLSAAVVDFADGRDDLAVEQLRRLMSVDRVVSQSPTLAAHQLGINLRARIAAMAEKMEAPALFPDGPAHHPAQSDNVRALVDSLLDDRGFHEQFARLSAVHLLNPDPMTGRILDPGPSYARVADENSWWLAPLQWDEQRRSLEGAATWLPVISADTFEAYRLMPEVARPNYSNMSQIVFNATNFIDFQLERISQQHFRALADGRIAAVLLGTWMANQNGVSPPGAEGLVPKYLPAAPEDPFAADGRPLRYRLDTEGPTVWSVGENGVDEGGLILTPTRGRMTEQPDVVYGAAWRVARAAWLGTPLPSSTSTAPATSRTEVPATIPATGPVSASPTR